MVIKSKEVAYSQKRAQFSVLVNFRSIRITIRKPLKLVSDNCGAAQVGFQSLKWETTYTWPSLRKRVIWRRL